MLSTEEMKSILAKTSDQMDLTRAKIDYLLQRTNDMFDAVDKGRDKQECFNHWVTLIDNCEELGVEGKAYYNAIVFNVAQMLDEWAKVETGTQEDIKRIMEVEK